MRRKARRHSNRGNALVEMAFALVILAPLFLGVVQFGLACFYYAKLQNAVRGAARFAGYQTYESASSTPPNALLQAVRNMAVFGSPGGGSRPVVPGLRPENIAVQIMFSRAVPDQVLVTVSNYEMNVLVRRFRLNRPSAQFPYVGRYAPPI